MAHDNGQSIPRKLAQPRRNLVHGHMYDAWNARKLQFPVFAHVQNPRVFPAIAACLELLDRYFPDHALELKRVGALRVLERIDRGLEQAGAGEGAGRTFDQQGFLRHPVAHHDK
jgi:hypothetical protein